MDHRMPSNAFICDAIRTPFGRYGGALSSVRADDLGAVPLKALMSRNTDVDWAEVTDVIFGCANQAGEDNRNVARMSSLLAGLPIELPGTTINRLCGSGMDSVGTAARAIKSGEAQIMIAGGVESMSSEGRLLRCRNHARHDRAKEGGPDCRFEGRAPARDLDGRAGPTERCRASRRHGDRGQRFRCQ